MTPWTGTHHTRLSIGFSRQECWSELPFPSPGDLPNPGMEPGSPALQSDSLLCKPQGKLSQTISPGSLAFTFRTLDTGPFEFSVMPKKKGKRKWQICVEKIVSRYWRQLGKL